MKKTGAVIFCWLWLVCLCSYAAAEDNWLSSVLAARQQDTSSAQKYAALLYIEGEISAYSYGYDHLATLDVIDALAQDAGNAALVMVFNTPGGGLYEADELYHAVQTYKQNGRPVYAYMAQECCSAGVFAAMAADTIYASRMTLTGNVGVYMQTYSEAGLLDKLGVKNEYIASGENKVAGYPQLTAAQRQIYEEIVAENFGYFKEVITAARGLTQEQMALLADGRLLTGKQARELGLVDDVIYFDEALLRIESQVTGGTGARLKFEDVTPEMQYGYEAEQSSAMDWLLELMQGDEAQTQGMFCPPSAQKSGVRR